MGCLITAADVECLPEAEGSQKLVVCVGIDAGMQFLRYR
jgi:hypothetical protein